MPWQILIAILNRYYNFSHPNELIYTYWYVAEVATAVYVGNVPLCWQFIAHVFKMGTWASFGSEQRPMEPQNEDGLAGKMPRRRYLQSMLPASLWSTRGGGDSEATYHTREYDSGAGARRISRTISEEAIMSDAEVVYENGRNVELATILQKHSSWTSGNSSRGGSQRTR